MSARADSFTPVGDEIKAILKKELDAGWSVATVAAEMQRAGHKGWTGPVVQAAANKPRALTVDEAISLLGLFKGRAQLLGRRVEEATATFMKGAQR